MIEYFTIDGREIPLSISASTSTRSFGRLSWLQHAKDVSRTGNKYYATSEKLVFFDNEPALSIAAQLAEWFNTNIPKGRQFIYVPGDTLMYCAELLIHNDYVLVDSENLLSFEQALKQIKKAPLNSHIHTSGDLQSLLKQHGFDLVDLQIDLEPGSVNPYWLKRGRTLAELYGGAFVLVVMTGIGALTVQWQSEHEIKPTQLIRQSVPEPESFVQLHNEIDELVALMSASSVWLNYGLERITITKSGADYVTRLEGDYRVGYPLPRLRELAGALGGQFMLQGDAWTVETQAFEPESGESHELMDILDNIDDYQRLVKTGYIELDLGTVREERRYRTADLTLEIDRPFPEMLAGIARHIQRHNIHGVAQKIDVDARPGHGWQSLSIDINLLGI